MTALWSGKEASISPKTILDSVSQIAPSLADGDQHDAHELLEFCSLLHRGRSPLSSKAWMKNWIVPETKLAIPTPTTTLSAARMPTRPGSSSSRETSRSWPMFSMVNCAMKSLVRIAITYAFTMINEPRLECDDLWALRIPPSPSSSRQGQHHDQCCWSMHDW